MVPFGDSHTAKVSRGQQLAGVEGGRTLLQVEFLHARLVRRDGGALDADAILFDSLGGVDGDLVVGLVAVFEALYIDIRRIRTISVRGRVPDRSISGQCRDT
jgi:hypothetical protein